VDLYLLNYFLAVVDRGGITKAARFLYISQPSLSRAIRTLERRLGVVLFDRSNGRLTLTEDGRRLEEMARGVLGDVDQARARVKAVRDIRSGYVDVAALSHFVFDPMIELVCSFREAHSDVLVRVIDCDVPASVHAALRRGEAELAVTDLSVESVGITTVQLYEQELVLAVPPDVADLPNCVPQALVRQVPLVVDLADRTNPVHSGNLLADDSSNVAVDCADPMATWQLVSRGVGATIIPAEMARYAFPDVPVHQLDPPLTRRVGLARRAGELSPAAASFWEVAVTLGRGR